MSALDEEARRIITEGTGADMPPGDAAARIWRQVHARLDLPLSPVASAAANGLGTPPMTGFVSSLGAKLVAGSLVLGAAATGVMAYVGHASEPAPGPDASIAVGAAARVPASPLRSPVAEALRPTSRSAAVLTPEKPPEPSKTSRSSASSLTEETPLVFEAQRALGAGMPARALSLLEQHRARFPRGELAQEREVARAVSLCMLGRAADVERARARFLHDWPESPLASRMRAVCSND